MKIYRAVASSIVQYVYSISSLHVEILQAQHKLQTTIANTLYSEGYALPSALHYVCMQTVYNVSMQKQLCCCDKNHVVAVNLR